MPGGDDRGWRGSDSPSGPSPWLDRLGLPLVSLVDTPGANASSASENEGIAAEIARTFAAMAALRSPSVAVCVGEGGSGGALALAWSDRLLVQEHAIFSVIAPEGAAAILERDASRAPAVAEHMGLTSTDLMKLGVVDAVVPESAEGVRVAVEAALADARGRRPCASAGPARFIASVRWLTD